jgi:hypothetical protein
MRTIAEDNGNETDWTIGGPPSYALGVQLFGKVDNVRARVLLQVI